MRNENNLDSFNKTTRLKHILIGISGIVIGLACFPIVENIPPNQHIFKLILEHIASIFIAVFTLHLISEAFLKKDMLQLLDKRIEYSINNALPASFKGVKHSGIVDVYEHLNFEKLADHLKRISKTEIIILTIWIPYFPYLREALVNAVNKRNCSVKILVLDFNSNDILKQRAASINKHGYSATDLKEHIRLGSRELFAAFSEIDDDKKENFQCRFYSEWVSAAIYGYGDEILIGHYLANNLSTEFPYIKIAGRDKTLYTSFQNHFDEIWKRSLKKEENNICIEDDKTIE